MRFFFIFVGIFFSFSVNSVHINGPSQSLTDHFATLNFEGKLKLTEDSLYLNPSLSPEFVANIKPLINTYPINIQHRFLLVEAYLALGSSNTDLASQYLEIIQRQNPSVNVLARMLYLQARIAQYLDDLVLAFDYLNSAQQIPKEQLSLPNQMFLLMLSADLNDVVNRVELALSYASMAKTVIAPMKNSDLNCFAMSGYAQIVAHAKQYEQLKTVVNEAISYCQMGQNKFILADIYMDFATTLLEKKQYSEHQRIIYKAIDIYIENHYFLNVPAAKLELVFSYISQNDLVSAQQILDELSSMEWTEGQRKELYRAQAILFEKGGLESQALFFYKKYLAIELDDIDTDIQKKLAYTQAQFDSKLNNQVAEFSNVELETLMLNFTIGRLEIYLSVALSLFILSIPAYLLTYYNPFYRKKLRVIEGGLFDDLTAVYHFEEGLKRAKKSILSVDVSDKYYAVVTIDIDYMKAINHSFNYDFGDRFIRVFAANIKTIYIGKGIITRVQRNDFVIFLLIDQLIEIDTLLTDTHLFLKKLEIDGYCPNATCSIGYSVKSINAESDLSSLCTSLVGQASIALRFAKYHGGDQSTLYNSELISNESLLIMKTADEYINDDELVSF